MSTAHLITELTEHALAQRLYDSNWIFRSNLFSAHGISALLRIQHAADRARVVLIPLRASPI